VRKILLALLVATLPVAPVFGQANQSGTSAPGSEAARSPFKFPSWSLPRLPSPSLPKMPKMQLPKLSLPARPPGTPSTWDRLNQGTRTFLAKTRSTLMPWAEPSNDATRRTAARTPRTAAKKPSLTSSWFGKKAEESEIETVNEFLESPRPMPFE
jgi:hypothetical protein